MSSMDIDSSCVTSCDTCHAAPLLEFGLVPFGFLWKDRLQGLSPGTTPVVPWWSPGGPLVVPWWSPGGPLVVPCPMASQVDTPG